ncbi:MAG: PQQ-dependent catabolism-associated CXXCW motif protein [Hyphomicrobiaceae bacterium]
MCGGLLAAAVLGVYGAVGSVDAKAGGEGGAPVATSIPSHEAAPPEPGDFRLDAYRAPVPATLKGARVVDATVVAAEHDSRAAVLIDVYPRPPKPAGLPPGTIWRSTKHQSIEGAHWLPNVGYGKLADEPEAYFRHALEKLTAGDRAKPLVFFCLADCWMSWNAAKRALEWGYANVAWFPQGIDGWREIGRGLVDLEPEPGPDGKVPE